MCELCGYDPCRPMRHKLRDMNELSVEEWKLLHDFIFYVQLPFVHSLVIRARKREGLNVKTGRLIHGNVKGGRHGKS